MNIYNNPERVVEEWSGSQLYYIKIFLSKVSNPVECILYDIILCQQLWNDNKSISEDTAGPHTCHFQLRELHIV